MADVPSLFADLHFNRASWCLFYGSGIISTLVLYGLLQERIMTRPYGGEFFTVSAFLVLCNRVCNSLYAGGTMALRREEFGNKAPMWKYFVISMSNVLATTCQYECLKYVSFPVQMLGKSFKMMPVMLWGIAISGKRHTSVDWAVAACVTCGVTEFLLTGPMSSPNDHQNSMWGLALLIGFLAFDGLTSTFQEKLFKDHPSSKFNQMLYVNLCSAIVSLVTVVSSGQMGYCLAFAAAHGEFVGNAALLSGAAAGSQYFIYSQVKEYGALVFAATMNVRQVASILISYTAYEHSISSFQVIGLLLVFGSLFYKSYAGIMSSEKEGKGLAAEEKAPLIKKLESDCSPEPKESA